MRFSSPAYFSFLVVAVLLSAVLLSATTRAIEPDADTHRQLIAGLQFDGDKYRALRPQSMFEVVEFSVSISNAESERTLTVTLGPDFVVERENTHVAIYDFHFQRLLEFEDSDSNFSNDSLFGAWHLRWAFLQNNLWTASILATGGIAGDPALARFWIEQHNGVNYPSEIAYKALPKPHIQTSAQRKRMTIDVGDTTVADIQYGSVPFPSGGHASTFAGWLTWSLRFHPDVATALLNAGTLPASIDRVTKDTIPEETAHSTLRFVDAELSTDAFEALAGLNARIPNWEPLFPRAMAELMVAAARGQAPNGPVSDEEYIAEISDLLTRRRLFDAALLAFHATLGHDDCKGRDPDKPLCDIAIFALGEAQSDARYAALFAALNKDQAGEHADAARALIAIRSDEVARPDILEIMIANALVEAKNKGQLDDPLSEEFARLPELFQSAFERDPYVPSRYRDYYNYLHAATSTVDEGYLVLQRAYPVIDLARSLPQRRVPKIVSLVTDVERNIRRDFPVHFPIYVDGE